MNNKIYLNNGSVEGWRTKLANPNGQWKKGNSARTAAYCWSESAEYPQEVFNLLNRCGIASKEPFLVIPEYKVSLPPYGKAASQNDIFILSKSIEGEVVAIMIEAKVDESFGSRIKRWIDEGDRSNREVRLRFLQNKLEMERDISELGRYYYQLFHRCASAIIAAEDIGAKKAIMIVHSFSQLDKRFGEYSDFIKLLNSDIEPKTDDIYHIKKLASGIDLFIGWAKGDKRYLTM